MQQQQQEDNRAEQQIRTQDPLFSLAGFYADVQNKLSVIHFSEKLQDAAAFAFDEAVEEQISAHLPQYRDLISMETESISLSGYRVTQRFQEADVTATLALLTEKNGKGTKRKETVRLHMVKALDCKTQAVCSPAFTVCKICGAPMSLLDGRICSYCGGARNLAEVDWAIREYEILS